MKNRRVRVLISVALFSLGVYTATKPEYSVLPVICGWWAKAVMEEGEEGSE
jgi:hypothetical protein